MDASTVIAICGVVIAVASLGVAAYVAWATRKHDRLSVRPLLGLTTTFPAGATAGLRLTNSGLGPARIISSQLTFDGEQFGEFNKPNVDEFRRRLHARPREAHRQARRAQLREGRGHLARRAYAANTRHCCCQPSIGARLKPLLAYWCQRPTTNAMTAFA